MAELKEFALQQMSWELCGDCTGGELIASPADYKGRGIAVDITLCAEPLDVSEHHVYLLWRHRQVRKRGCEELFSMDAAAGRKAIYWPRAMANFEGVVECQLVLSYAQGGTITSRTFLVRVQEDLVAGVDAGDGFTLFVDMIKRYEDASGELLQVAEQLRRDAAEGNFNGRPGDPGPTGKQGPPGRDGVSPVVSIEDSGEGAPMIKVETAAGVQSATVLRGPKGEKGERGDKGEKGERGEKGDKGEKGDAGAKGEKGDTGPQGEHGIDGVDGTNGVDGVNGISVSHSWDGTVLNVTSASGTSGVDLRGPEGPAGKDLRSGGCIHYPGILRVANRECSITDKPNKYVVGDRIIDYAGQLFYVRKRREMDPIYNACYYDLDFEYKVYDHRILTVEGVDLAVGETKKEVRVDGYDISAGEYVIDWATGTIMMIESLGVCYEDYSFANLKCVSKLATEAYVKKLVEDIISANSGSGVSS